MDKKQEVEKTENFGSYIERILEQRVLFKGIGDSVGELELGCGWYEINDK